MNDELWAILSSDVLYTTDDVDQTPIIPREKLQRNVPSCEMCYTLNDDSLAISIQCDAQVTDKNGQILNHDDIIRMINTVAVSHGALYDFEHHICLTVGGFYHLANDDEFQGESNVLFTDEIADIMTSGDINFDDINTTTIVSIPMCLDDAWLSHVSRGAALGCGNVMLRNDDDDSDALGSLSWDESTLLDGRACYNVLLDGVFICAGADTADAFKKRIFDLRKNFSLTNTYGERSLFRIIKLRNISFLSFDRSVALTAIALADADVEKVSEIDVSPLLIANGSTIVAGKTLKGGKEKSFAIDLHGFSGGPVLGRFDIINGNAISTEEDPTAIEVPQIVSTSLIHQFLKLIFAMCFIAFIVTRKRRINN